MTRRIASPEMLTDFERRLVPWLPTRLSFGEIGTRLDSSEWMVKATAVALYRGLGVVNRAEAIRRCIQMGLLDRYDATHDVRAGVPTQQDADRESLEALDEAFFHMQSVRDADGRIVDFEYRYCNPAALAVIGRTREAVTGRRLLELFPSHATAGLFDAYVQVTETGVPLRYEFSFDEGGVAGEFEVVVCRLGDGYVLSGHDIAHRKRRERELLLVKNQLQSALSSRVLIEQAKGYAAAKTGADPDSAFHAMRQHAEDNNRPIDDVARSILEGRTVVG